MLTESPLLLAVAAGSAVAPLASSSSTSSSSSPAASASTLPGVLASKGFTSQKLSSAGVKEGICFADGPTSINWRYSIQFPAEVPTAATWDRGLFYSRASSLAKEYDKVGANVPLSIVVGPAGRSPYGGRKWEGFSAEPIGAPQGGYFLSYPNQTIDSAIDQVTARELYVAPFAEAIRAGARNKSPRSQQHLDAVWQWTVLKSYAATSDTLDSFQAVPVSSWADFRRRAVVQKEPKDRPPFALDGPFPSGSAEERVDPAPPRSPGQADALRGELAALLMGSDADELIGATLEHAGGFAMGKTACIDYDFLLVLDGKRPKTSAPGPPAAKTKAKGKAKAKEETDGYQVAVEAARRAFSVHDRCVSSWVAHDVVAVGTAKCFAGWHDLRVVMLRWRDTDGFVVHIDIPVTWTDRKGATAVWWSSAASFVGGLQRSAHSYNEAFSAGGYYSISGTVVAPCSTPTEVDLFRVAQLQFFGALLRHSDVPRWPHLTIEGDSVRYEDYSEDGWVCLYQWGHRDPPLKDNEDALRKQHDPPFVGQPREPSRSNRPFPPTAVLPEDSDTGEEGDAEAVKDASPTPPPSADREVVEKPPADSSPLPSISSLTAKHLFAPAEHLLYPRKRPCTSSRSAFLGQSHAASSGILGRLFGRVATVNGAG
ncbi:hypothetical protein Rt10032_c01g0496 [Rhodotorula toruloides]|uniref:beta-glucosidase n=1 Tax=Rhodotorula toruloides TaxID=5286 RepID=A0A511K804_RHOTO|nr:hypothetical protein Rt10032_c01g0496 [Rhodotorula toruloides]